MRVKIYENLQNLASQQMYALFIYAFVTIKRIKRYMDIRIL